MKSRHPIRIVAHRTQLSAEVIRAWELRYQAVTPERTPSGQRLYSDADIRRLSLLRQVTAAGRGIGQVASLSTPELVRLVAEHAPAASPAAAANDIPAQALEALRAFDLQRLESLLRAAAVTMNVESLIESVLAPFMTSVGEAWHTGAVDVAQEHLATGIVREVLTSLPRAAGQPLSAPLVVIATPAGQRHEVGAMMAAATAFSEGWRVCYLGADVPSRQIGAMARRGGAKLIAVSITYADDANELDGELKALRRAAGSVPVVAGGRAAGALRPALKSIGATVHRDTSQLRATLRSLGRHAA